MYTKKSLTPLFTSRRPRSSTINVGPTTPLLMGCYKTNFQQKKKIKHLNVDGNHKVNKILVLELGYTLKKVIHSKGIHFIL